MRRAAARLAWRYALPALAGLALIGRIGAVVAMPPEFAGLAIALGFAGRDDATVLPIVGGAVAVALATSAILAVSRSRVRRPMLPALLLSFSAGISEELFFRLFLPLAITLLTGSALAGFALSLVLFVVAHRHQGARGMAGVAVAGLGLTLLYLASGMLWAAIALHIVVDLNALVLRRRSRVSSSAASRS